MVIPLLVVSTDASFGALIRRNLEESGRFQVHVVASADEAGQYASDKRVSLAFLDTDKSDEEVIQAGRALRHANKHIRFIIASGGGWHAGLEELDPLGYLTKPVYLPDLREIMTKIYPASKDQTLRSALTDTRTKPVNGTEPPWLADVSRAAQHLTRLTLETSAQAALITRKDALWAYAGGLPQAAARELADVVARYRDHRGESDLLRFVRLVSTNAEHMLYATRLAGGMVLALVFDAETPFSTIRSQAGQLVRSLSTTPPAETPSQVEEDEDSGPVPSVSFADILTDVPPPNPHDGAPATPKLSIETSPAIPLQTLRMQVSPNQAAPDQAAPSQEVERPVISRDFPPIVPLKPLVYTDQDRGTTPATSQETRPAGETARTIVLEPISPSVYNLTYACLLIPRFTDHLLAGELAEQLTEWVLQTCVAFGWRLEHISVHPDYFQWIVNIPPATSPAYLMRIVRQHTSEKIFAEYPRFKKENPSGDFWAPGYLIMGGTQSPPAQLIREFILQTRQRQGITQRAKP